MMTMRQKPETPLSHDQPATCVGLFGSFISRGWFNDDARRTWSDVGTLQTWLEVEAALAEAQAELKLIPAEAAQTIRARADAQAFDLERLARDIAFTGHQLVPVLRQFEELCGEPAAGYIHWGATTQNIFETAQSLQMRKSHRLVLGYLDAAIEQLAVLAKQHQTTLQAGRTHGQHALPMTFGFKVAGWLDELARDRCRLEQRFSSSFVASMGGAIGTFAAVGVKGPEVERLMAQKLGLEPAGLPMRSSYDRVSDYVGTLGLLAGTTHKIAQDLYFLQRNEIGEVEEAFHLGKVGSSTMAQKRNPMLSSTVIALARQLRARVTLVQESMVRMDEGDCTANNVTDTVIPEVGLLAVSITETFAKLVQGLTVHPEAMRRNAGLSNGLIVSEAVMMTLSQFMGRHHAHQLAYAAAQRSISEGLPFLDAIREHPLLKSQGLPAGFEKTLAIDAYVGESARLVDEVIARLKADAVHGTLETNSGFSSMKTVKQGRQYL